VLETISLITLTRQPPRTAHIYAKSLAETRIRLC